MIFYKTFCEYQPRIAQVKIHLHKRFLSAFFSKFCQPKSCLCPWKRINTWNVHLSHFQRQNAVQNRIAKLHCKIALQNCTEKLHCKIALQNCAAKLHCKIALWYCTEKLHCKIALQNCTATLHWKIALKNCIAKLHCKITLWNRTAKSHCKIAPRNCTAKSHVAMYLKSAPDPHALRQRQPVNWKFKFNIFQKVWLKREGGGRGSLWTNVSERVSVKKPFFLSRSCCDEIS